MDGVTPPCSPNSLRTHRVRRILCVLPIKPVPDYNFSFFCSQVLKILLVAIFKKYLSWQIKFANEPLVMMNS